MKIPTPAVLAFDVFGTVVDWYGGIRREVEALQLGVDANAFALAWRDGYQPAMRRVMSGELGWTLIDDLHRLILDQLLAQYGVHQLSEAQIRQLNKAWHRLDPWPDVVAGLARLKSRYTICTLSNGNLGLLADMAKRAALPWDCILSAEVFKAYKPDPATGTQLPLPARYRTPSCLSSSSPVWLYCLSPGCCPGPGWCAGAGPRSASGRFPMPGAPYCSGGCRNLPGFPQTCSYSSSSTSRCSWRKSRFWAVVGWP